VFVLRPPHPDAGVASIAGAVAVMAGHVDRQAVNGDDVIPDPTAA
jgi:hypothetical protein